MLLVAGSPVTTAPAAPVDRSLALRAAVAEEHTIRLVEEADGAVERLAKWSDVVVAVGLVPASLPALVESGRPLAWDAHARFELESTAEGFDRTHLAVAAHLRVADVLLVPTEDDRDFWLGELASAGRVNPRVYDGDPTMREFVRVLDLAEGKAPGLVEFCRNPHPAADRPRPPAARRSQRVRAFLRLARDEGLGAAVTRVMAVVSRRLRRS